MKRLLTVSVLALSLTSVGCSSNEPQDFDSPEQRQELLFKYACKKMETEESQLVYSAAGSAALDYTSDKFDRTNIIREELLGIRMELSPSCTPGEIGYFDWLEEGYAAHLDKAFTYEKAKEEGLLDE